ncbi:MAG: indole-3-glycerol-phosphate synthase [Desulfovibrio sp.]|nr:indole-3-glycerol-phosphate synthase [Desulfovibrio sp.]
MSLERFRQAKLAEIESLRRAADQGVLPPAYAGTRPDFTAALRVRHRGDLPSVIAEYKCASPSRGSICQTLQVEEVARQYAACGAAALSVLTEEQFFQGKLAYVERAVHAMDGPATALPVLRKDFLYDPLQILMTASTPASALLLIVRLSPQAAELRNLRELTEAYGMQAVVEIFDEKDLRLARESGARIIQVNARDLDSLVVNREACLALARKCPPEAGETWIAASGMSQGRHMRQVAEAGFHAALVGSALMQDGRPGEALAAMLR